MQFRPATLADAALLRRWRNDPMSCAMSRNTAPVGEGEHRAWLIATLESNFRDLWIWEVEGAPVGTLRVDFEDNWPTAPPGRPELSWTIAPEHRGKGLGKRMVAGFVAQHPAAYRTEIKADNLASLAIAKAANLRPSILDPVE